MDEMYMAVALLYGKINFAELDLVAYSMKFAPYWRKLAAALTLFWGSLCSVKFSFLALFKRLVVHMPGMIKYWWFTVVFNVLISCYGATIYTIGCPYFRKDQLFEAGKFNMGP